MSNTIKVIHMCDHVVPETEITTQINDFVTGEDVCEISTQPIHIINCVEYFGIDASLNPGDSSILLANRVKVDDFCYQIEGDTFSTPIELCESKTFLDLEAKTKVRGRIDGIAFPDGFMFGKLGVSPATQIIAQNGVAGYTADDSVWVQGNGSNATISFTKPVFFTEFTNLFLFAHFKVPTGATSFQLRLTIPGIFDDVIFEKTTFETANAGDQLYTIAALKISIPGSGNFDATISGDALFKASVTMASAAATNGIFLKMRTDKPGVGYPTFIDLRDTGYEHLSEKTLQRIFSMDTGSRTVEKNNGANGIHIDVLAINAFSGQLISQSSAPVMANHGWNVIDPETNLPIKTVAARVVILIGVVTPLTEYEVSNNAGYANVIYWVDAVNKCVGISRGLSAVAPIDASFALICSNPGEGYTAPLRYSFAIKDATSSAFESKPLLPQAGVTLYGIPFGKKDFYEIGLSINSLSTKKINLVADDIVSLYTGSAGHDLITLRPFERSAEFTTDEKEFKTFAWHAPEISAVSIASITIAPGHIRHYSCPIDQAVKILVPKGTVVNLTDAKIKFTDFQFIYELEFPEETSSYKLMLEDMDFTRLGQNAIKWDVTSPWATDDGTTLTATLETKQSLNRRYDEYSCPRCSGNGWYVSTTSDASGSIKSVTGSDKMVQDFLKILLTDIRYYKPGTAFITLKGFVKRDQKIEDLIVLYIKDAETQLRQLQYNMSIAGSEISEYEELKTVIIESIDATSSQDRIYVEIRLVNMASEYTSIGLAV